MEKTQYSDVFSIITDRIIEQLQRQSVPWRKPWSEGGHPQNLLTKRHYTGINTWLLGSLGYAQNHFMTWNQVKSVGASVRKGEKGAMVVFWKRLLREPTEEDDQQKVSALLRYYHVFNVAQLEDLPDALAPPELPSTADRIGTCEEIVERMPHCPPIEHRIRKAFYDPARDCVNMPRHETFGTPEGYYSTLFHELVHSTGHKSRLNRREVVEPNRFGSEPYGIEELTAEIGACYLNSVSGIAEQEFDNSMAYIRGWMGALKADRRMIVYASGRAKRATDYILNVNSYQDGETGEAALIKTH